jgi:hypothetical protein
MALNPTLTDLLNEFAGGQGPSAFPNRVVIPKGRASAGTLTAGSDYVIGNSLDNGIDGLNGFDALDGGAGNDQIFGGRGIDLIAGNSDGDTLVGGASWDVISGGGGNDVITGLGRSEFLDSTATTFSLGGVYDDILYGGNGKDKFDLIYQGNGYFSQAKAASIKDFEPGVDKIRVGTGVDLRDDLGFLANTEFGFTEVLDKRGLTGPILAFVNETVPGSGSIGDINPGGAFSNVIARVFTRGGESPIDIANRFYANPGLYFENSNGIA